MAARGSCGARPAWATLLVALLFGCGPSESSQPSSSASRSEGPGLGAVRFGSGDDARGVELDERDGRVRVEVIDPYEERPVVFEALPARPVLDELLGDRWREADELIFECADGYRAAVPVGRLLEHEPYFAVARVDGELAIQKPVGGETVHTSLAPAYLIWENQNDGVVRGERDWGWPYQIVAVEIAERASERYARMAPPRGARDAGPASESAERGFHAFRRYCSRCHPINGVGGEVGPELNYPASVSEYMKPSWLRRWIDAPLTVRHGTPMPGLPSGIPAREKTLNDLVAYLEAMAQRKISPSEDRAGSSP